MFIIYLQKKFPKTLDKCANMWYNKCVKGRGNPHERKVHTMLDEKTTSAIRAICALYFDSEDPVTIEVEEMLEEGLELCAVEAFCKGFLTLISPEE